LTYQHHKKGRQPISGIVVMKQQLTLDDQKALSTLASSNWGSWTLPEIGIPYTASQVEEGNEVATVVKFDYPVTAPDGFTSKKMRVYPISKRKPDGKVSALRS
jgi:hypothetical protein